MRKLHAKVACLQYDVTLVTAPLLYNLWGAWTCSC